MYTLSRSIGYEGCFHATALKSTIQSKEITGVLESRPQMSQVHSSCPLLSLISHVWLPLLPVPLYSFLFFFLRFYLFIFRGRGGGREGKKHQCVVASHTPQSGDLARNPGMCPDWDLNRQPFGLQADTQSTEPQQPGLCLNFSIWQKWTVYR